MYAVLINAITNFAAACQPKGSVLGLTPWFAYLDGKTDPLGKCVPVINDYSDMWLIGLAVIDSLLRVAGMVAVGFIIYGGFQYMTSSGEPDRTKKAKDTILNALIGLVITIIAASVVSYIGNTLGN